MRLGASQRNLRLCRTSHGSSSSMKAAVLDEPVLEFGGGGRHLDPRFGLISYGPADLGTSGAPSTIRVGVVGDAAGVDGLREWLLAYREPLAARKTRLENLFPSFPGFTTEGPFASEVAFDDRLQRLLAPRPLDRLSGMDRDTAIREAVDLFCAEIESLSEGGRCDVILCARPPQLRDEKDEEETEEGVRPRSRGTPPGQIDFHDLLKARAMKYRVPIQIVRPTTWDPTKARAPKRTTPASAASFRMRPRGHGTSTPPSTTRRAGFPGG
jgi:hypothetical protein